MAFNPFGRMGQASLRLTCFVARVKVGEIVAEILVNVVQLEQHWA